MDWSDCKLVETVPGKMSGAPVLAGTRVPVAAIAENYDGFLSEGLSHDDAVEETSQCYPEAGVDRIKAILDYRAIHQLQPQH